LCLRVFLEIIFNQFWEFNWTLMYMSSKTSLNQCIFYTSNLHYSDIYHISKCSAWKVAQKCKRGWKTVSSKLTTICIDFFQPRFLLGSNLGAFSCGIFGNWVSQKSYFWNTHNRTGTLLTTASFLHMCTTWCIVLYYLLFCTVVYKGVQFGGIRGGYF